MVHVSRIILSIINDKTEHWFIWLQFRLINDRVLRKYSPTADYNSRLLSQADKQVVFGNRIYKYRCTKVYDIQKNYFDMEYIGGKVFDEFFRLLCK